MVKDILQLRVARIVRGWTLWQAARNASVSLGRLSYIERGLLEPSEEERQRIAQAFEVTAETLFQPAVDPSQTKTKTGVCQAPV